MNNQNAITPSKMKELLPIVLKNGLTPYIVSSPGTAKSTIIKQIAKERNLELVDIRLSTMSEVDLMGFPVVRDNVATFVPFDTFPTESTKLPKGKDGWILLLDELSTSSPSIQAAAYRLILDREVGSHKLHKSVFIVAAGNKLTDKAVVHKMSTALQSRMVNLELLVDVSDWMKWAIESSIDTRIRAYINFKNDALHNFNPTKNVEASYPCPRSWSFVSKIISKYDNLDDVLPLIAGSIGESTALEFHSFTSIFSELPDIKAIMDDPENINITTQPSTLFAIAEMVGSRVNTSNASILYKYILRLPIEFQIIVVNIGIIKYKEFNDCPETVSWKVDHVYKLMS